MRTSARTHWSGLESLRLSWESGSVRAGQQRDQNSERYVKPLGSVLFVHGPAKLLHSSRRTAEVLLTFLPTIIKYLLQSREKESTHSFNSKVSCVRTQKCLYQDLKLSSINANQQIPPWYYSLNKNKVLSWRSASSYLSNSIYWLIKKRDHHIKSRSFSKLLVSKPWISRATILHVSEVSLLQHIWYESMCHYQVTAEHEDVIQPLNQLGWSREQVTHAGYQAS